jgi:hypothetical protein
VVYLGAWYPASELSASQRTAGDTFKLRETPKARATNRCPKGRRGPVNSHRGTVTLREMLQWTIRSQAPKAAPGHAQGGAMEKVQRLDGGGCRLKVHFVSRIPVGALEV